MVHQNNNLLILTDLVKNYKNSNYGDLIVLRPGITKVKNTQSPWPLPLDVAFAQGRNDLLEFYSDIYRIPVLNSMSTPDSVEKMLSINVNEADCPKRFMASFSSGTYLQEFSQNGVTSKYYYTACFNDVKSKLIDKERRRIDYLVKSITI